MVTITDPFIGKVIDGFRIQAMLGRGGMGVVYRAVDEDLGRTVALKMVEPSLAQNHTFLRRFRAEAQALARLNSPHIVVVHALRKTRYGFFIVMEYVSGGTLSDLITRHSLSPEETTRITRQILHALTNAHDLNIIHRDIKPRNVLLTEQGDVKITDFGLAKILRGGDSTVTQGMTGTLYYMSPEQVKGSKDIDHRTDLYSVGMTMYEMLTGRVPFDKSESDFTIMRMIVEQKLPPMDSFSTDIPPHFRAIISKCLEKDPDRRFQSAREILDQLGRTTKAPLPAKPANRLQQRRRRWFGYAAGLLPIVALVVALVLYDVIPISSIGVAGERSARESVQTAVDESADHEEGSVSALDEEAPALESDQPATESGSEVGIVELAALVVTSEPGGARVLLDGTYRGNTPLTISELNPGRYTVRLERDGFETLILTESVTGGDTRRVSGRLVQQMGTLNVSVRPSGDVYVNGRLTVRGLFGRQELQLPAGTHRIAVRHDERGEEERRVTIQPGTTTDLNFDLRTVSLRIAAFVEGGGPAFGEIFVDGGSTGLYSPGSVEARAGTRQIEVRFDGHAQVGLRIGADGRIVPGNRLNIDPDLIGSQPIHVILRAEEP